MHQSWKRWMKISRNALSPRPAQACGHAVSVSPLLYKKSIHLDEPCYVCKGQVLILLQILAMNEWMLQRCQEHLGLLNFLLSSHHTPLTVCKNQQQYKDSPLWELQRSQSPGTPDKQRGFECYSAHYGNIATSTLGGVLYAHTVCLHDAGPPRFTQPDEV